MRWLESTKVIDHRRKFVNRVFNVFWRGETPEPESNSRRWNPIVKYSAEDMRWGLRRRAARRSRRHGDVADADQQRLAVDAVKAHVQVVRQAVSHGAVHRDAAYAV